jgi:hypothetical protein
MATPHEYHGSESRLVEYWTHGEGAAKIRWGQPGDFDRCIRNVEEAVTKHGGTPLPPNEIKGFCSRLHVRATGAGPGHAPGVEEAAAKAKKKN